MLRSVKGKIMNNKKKPIVLAVIMAFTLQSCATNTGIVVIDKTSNAMKETFNSDDPCNHNKRNTWAAIAGLVGAVIGAKVANNKGKSGAGGAVIGGAIGATVFGLIGNELDKRECELSKIAKQNGLELETTPIKSEVKVVQQNNAKTNKTEQADVGLSVSVVDQDSKPQFLTGSDKLQPYAQQHFQEIAKLYTVEHALKNAETQKPEELATLKKAMASKRILLIGHTDDTGDTNFNAKLSENRARAVAQIFEKAGISSSQLYYQGAGETMPMADNATEQGRAKNRRVEIVDLTDEDSFDLYLQNKRPNTQYYRPVIAQQEKLTPTVETKPKEEVKVTTKEEKPEVKQETKVVKNTQTQTKPKTNLAGYIDFGGKPFTTQLAKVDAGNVIPTKKGFSLISEAVASDVQRIETCNLDRPRNVGLVKSLKNDKAYSNTDFLPALNGHSWYQLVGGNMVVLHKVNVFRDSAQPANKPIFKVYANYKNLSEKNRNRVKPDINVQPEVNTYQTTNGLVYRIFVGNEKGLQCIDMLIPAEYSQTAKDGKVIYEYGDLHVADFKPTLQK